MTITLTGKYVDRFWAKVEMGEFDQCWPWTGSTIPKGYGYFRIGPKTYRVHRLVYATLTNPNIDDLKIDHTCFNRACCNPAHLRAITNRQNVENRQGANPNSKSGIRGVWQDPRSGRWRARVGQLGKSHDGGTYDTPEEADQAARALRLKLFTHNEMDRKASL